MAPLCPTCGYVLVRTELVSHIMYRCYNHDCKDYDGMFGIEGVETYFTPKAYLNEDTPTDKTHTPKCKGHRCGNQVACFHGCSHTPIANENMAEKIESWEKDLANYTKEVEDDQEYRKLRGDPPWHSCFRCGGQMNWHKWNEDNYKCVHCGNVTPQGLRPKTKYLNNSRK